MPAQATSPSKPKPPGPLLPVSCQPWRARSAGASSASWTAWKNDPHGIGEQRAITDAHIVPRRKGYTRRPLKRVD